MTLSTVLFIGAGDVAFRMASGLLSSRPGLRLVMADLNPEPAATRAALLGLCHTASVTFRQVDGTNPSALEALLKSVTPDLVVQSASMISPWAVIGRDHPVAHQLSSAGIAIQIPLQLPILRNVMRAVQEIGLAAPVANMSMRDILHPVLAAEGLAPTVGLGNVAIHRMRVAHQLQEIGEAPGPLRLLGHHCQVYDVMQARLPEPGERVQVYLGEDGRRSDDLAYQGKSFAAGPIYNEITAAAALPVLRALLPEASSLRFSTPAPFGLPGGYPVRVDQGDITLDLPPGVTRDDAIAWNNKQGRRDGVEKVDSDGTVYFTEAAHRAVADLDPDLAEPIQLADISGRTSRLGEVVAALK